MSRTLGVSCSPAGAFFALLVGGAAQARPERLLWPVGETSERLAVVQDQIADLMDGFTVKRGAILLPERDPRHKWIYETAATRASMETLIRLTAVRAKILIDMINRETVRSRLKVVGKLDLHLDGFVVHVGT